MLSDRQIRIAAYVLGQELARRQRNAIPIPDAFRDVHRALQAEVSANGRPVMPVLSRLKTTEQLAAEWGCTARTVRRKAVAAGGRKLHGQWIFDEQETP